MKFASCAAKVRSASRANPSIQKACHPTRLRRSYARVEGLSITITYSSFFSSVIAVRTLLDDGDGDA